MLRKLFIVPVTVLAIGGSTACATKKFVRTQVGEVRSGGSYLSHNDMRVHFGLGTAKRVDQVRIRWPNGKTETLNGMDAGQYVTIREGEAR